MFADRYVGEDKPVLSGGNLGKAWTLLTRIAVSMTRWLSCGERTLREVHEKGLADPRPIAKRRGLKK